MPVNTDIALTFTGTKLEPYQNPEDARTLAVQIASTSSAQFLKAGTVLAINSTSHQWVPYDNSGSGGAEIAKAILAYDINVDTTTNGGRITLSGTSGQLGGVLGEKYRTVPAYTGGTFHTANLIGSDGTTALTSTALTDALADLQALEISSDSTGSVFKF